MFIKAHPSRSVAKKSILRLRRTLAKQGFVGGADTLTGIFLSVNVVAQVRQMTTV